MDFWIRFVFSILQLLYFSSRTPQIKPSYKKARITFHPDHDAGTPIWSKTDSWAIRLFLPGLLNRDLGEGHSDCESARVYRFGEAAVTIGRGLPRFCLSTISECQNRFQDRSA